MDYSKEGQTALEDFVRIYELDMSCVFIFECFQNQTYHPLVLAVYSPSPSFPIGTCTPAPPAAVEEHDLASAVATAMLLVADRVDRRTRAVKSFMVPVIWRKCTKFNVVLSFLPCESVLKERADIIITTAIGIPYDAESTARA